MPFVPHDLVVLEPRVIDEFMLTSLPVDHRVLDCEAAMSSRNRLWPLFGPTCAAAT